MKKLKKALLSIALGCSSAYACTVSLVVMGPAAPGSALETGAYSDASWQSCQNYDPGDGGGGCTLPGGYSVLNFIGGSGNNGLYYSGTVPLGGMGDGPTDREFNIVFPNGSANINFSGIACGESYTVILSSSTQGACNVNTNGSTPQWGAGCTGVAQAAENAGPSYSNVSFNFINTTQHAMIAYVPQSAPLSSGAPGYTILPPDAQAGSDSDLEVAVSAQAVESPGAKEIAEVNGARFYISNSADQATFDSDIGLSTPSQASSYQNGSNYNMGNTMGLVQILGGSYQIGGSNCSVDGDYNDMIGCFAGPSVSVWEVAPANVVGSCGSSGGGGAFCWTNDGSGSAGFQFNLQDPPGRIISS